jgi:hypothetical protein
MRSRRRHLPPQTRWTEAATLAAERHQPRLLASVTAKPREAVRAFILRLLGGGVAHPVKQTYLTTGIC